MNNVFGFPEIVRFSWSSCSRILEESAVPVNWNDPISNDDIGKKRPAATFKSSEGKKENGKTYLSAYKCKLISEI